jgi:tetratricopeptide (TPR) repeat protein
MLVDQIAQALTQRHRILLQGLDGIGKTALAATVADSYLAQGNGPVLWLPIQHEFAPAIFDGLARKLATVEDMQQIGPLTGDAEVIAIRDLLRRREIRLIVLDDAQDGATLYRVLLGIPDDVLVIVTSQQRFALQLILEIPELSLADSLQLLAYHAENPLLIQTPDAANLCKILGFHPFALKIAGTRIRIDECSPHDLYLDIQAAPHDIAMPLGFDRSGLQGVKSSLLNSYQALSPEGQTVLQTMGAFFTHSATENLLTLALDGQASTVRHGLTDLKRRSLLNKVDGLQRFLGEDSAVTMYQLHTLTFSFARELSSAHPPDPRSLIDIFLTYLTTYTQEFDQLLCEQGNWLGAIALARQTEQFTAMVEMVTAVALGGYLDNRGHSLEFLTMLDDVISYLELDEETHRQTLHYLWGKRGNIFLDRGSFAEALFSYQNCLRLAVEPTRQIMAYAIIGRTLGLMGQDDTSGAHFSQAHAAAADNKAALGFIFQQQSQLAGVQKDYAAAQAYARKGLALSQEIGDLSGELRFRINLGSIELDAYGDARKALASHQEAQEMALAQNNIIMAAYALFAMGMDYHALAQYDDAQTCLTQARHLFNQSGQITAENDVLAYWQKVQASRTV